MDYMNNLGDANATGASPWLLKSIWEQQVLLAFLRPSPNMTGALINSSIAAYIRWGLSSAILVFLTYKTYLWSTSADPPRGSGLKRLPGPRSTFPYVGRIHDVDCNRVWTSMKRFNDVYEGLFKCQLGGFTHIWIGRNDIAQDLLCKNADISSDRGECIGAYPGIAAEYKYSPLMDYNQCLVRQRKFTHQILSRNREMAFQLYPVLEAKRFLFEVLNEPQNWFAATQNYTGRISARLAYGTDAKADLFVQNALEFIHQLGPSGPVTNLMPVLQWLPESIVKDKRSVRMRQEREKVLFVSSYLESKVREKSEDLAFTYTEASLAEDGKETKFFEDPEEAIYAVGMLCTVAIITIAGPLQLFVMAMVLHQEWQAKVREEIDMVIKDEQMVEFQHSKSLPVLRAAMKECLRWKPTVPLGVPRLLKKDYSYEGYHFPAGSLVHILENALAADPTLYPSPATYNPARWLEPSYPTYQGPLSEHPRIKGHHIFGRGKRACPGQDLVEAEMLTFCGNLLHFYELKPCRDARGQVIMPDAEDWGVDVIGGPKAFKCDFRIRNEAKRATIKRAYSLAFM